MSKKSFRIVFRPQKRRTEKLRHTHSSLHHHSTITPPLHPSPSQLTMMQADDAPTAPPTPLPAQQPLTNSPVLAQLLPYSLFDVVLDIPHPGSSRPSGTVLIYPPSNVGSGIVDLLPPDQLAAEFGPETANATEQNNQPSQGAAKICRFAFPEYEDRSNAQEAANRHALLQRTGASTSPGYNRHDVYLAQAFCPPENCVPPLPSHHVFSHRLANGVVVHGHVRRYLCPRDETGRTDVGRKSVRALVILTRASGGGGRLYNAMLKTLEVLKYKPGENDQKWFVHSMFQEHVNLCRDVGSAMTSTSNGQSPLSKPRIITLSLMEVGSGHGLFGSVDAIKYACPPSLLHEREPSNDDSVPGFSRNDMMPMLRCLGVIRAMRLLSALISEKRIILTSSNIAKLSAVSYGALSMMSQGMMPPPSVFVPILPPGLASLLSTPSAYMIGVLKGSTPNFIDLRNMVPTLGELVIFDLDSVGTEPFFVGITNPVVAVPDLTRKSFEDVGDSSLNGMSLPDVLYNDLSEVVKFDKKQMFWQGAVQEKLGLAAEKGKTAARNVMKKGLKYLKSKKSSLDAKEMKEEEDEEEDTDKNDSANSQNKFVGKGNYFYEQGFPNESAEVEARIAFTTFFVCLFGDLRAYLSQSTPGVPPVADRDKFMKIRATNGDLPGSSMYNLLNTFLSSNSFDQFVNCRLNELQLRRAVPEDAPLFALTTNYHRSNKIEFVANNIRQSVRQVATNPNLPGRYLTSWNEGIRRRALDLTSTQAFNGDPRRALNLLTEDCHESTSILIDTMMILWTRLQEGKGMQWKKALLALQIFRDLLLNGPVNAVAEAIDGFASIRILKSYSEAMRNQNSILVRAAASEVYNLTTNMPVLFAMRREYLNRQRMIKDPKPSPLRKETRMIKGISQFRNVHIALRPAGATVAPAPNDLLGQETTQSNGSSQSKNNFTDLLSLGLDEAAATGDDKQPNPFDMAAMSQSIPIAIADTSANQATQQQNLPQQATPIAVSGTSTISSQPATNGETPRSLPSTQQTMSQQQYRAAPLSSHQGLPSPTISCGAVSQIPPLYLQKQHQQTHSGMMQNYAPQMQIPANQQSNPIMPNQQPPFQQQQQPMQWQHGQNRQWGNSTQQSGPQGLNGGMPPQVGFQTTVPPQHQQGFQQPQQQQQQQQSNKRNFSMFDPMAK